MPTNPGYRLFRNLLIDDGGPSYLSWVKLRLKGAGGIALNPTADPDGFGGALEIDGTGTGPDPYDSNPADLGTASPGVSNEYARGDHVHKKPSAADVGAASATHAAQHKNGGGDEVGTSTPGANAIPKASASGKLDSWVSTATALVAGIAKLGAAGGAYAYDSVSTFMQTLLDDADAATARTTLGLGSMSTENTGSWVPSSRTVNSRALSSNIVVDAVDVGARYEMVGTTSYYPMCIWNGAPGGLTVLSTITNGRYYAKRWIPTRSGTIDQFAIYVANAAIGGKIAVALCSDSSGAPGTVLASAEIASNGLGKQTGSVSVSVTAGTVYWVVAVPNNSVNQTNGLTGAQHAGYKGWDLTATTLQVAEYVAGAYAWPFVLPAWGAPTAIVSSSNVFIEVFYRWSA